MFCMVAWTTLDGKVIIKIDPFCISPWHNHFPEQSSLLHKRCLICWALKSSTMTRFGQKKHSRNFIIGMIPCKDSDFWPFLNGNCFIGGFGGIFLKSRWNVKCHCESTLTVWASPWLNISCNWRCHWNLNSFVILSRNEGKQLLKHRWSSCIFGNVINLGFNPFLGRVQPLFITLRVIIEV